MTTSIVVKRDAPKKRNPIAKILRDPLFRKRIVKDKTVYDRKVEKEKEGDA